MTEPDSPPLRGGLQEFESDRSRVLRKRIRIYTLLLMLGLVLSGATAIPLESELDWLATHSGAAKLVAFNGNPPPPQWALWLTSVRSALHDASQRYGFLFYGTDWLAFGHFVIAIAFIGALRDPIRNAWLFSFGMIACVLVWPYALVFGALRGIPLWWRFIDCSFGLFGLIPLWLCRRWAGELENFERLRS